MDRHRGDRLGDRPGDRFGDRPGDRFGDGGRYPRMPSRWSSGSPTHQPQRYPRGGGGAGGEGEGFSGGGGGGGRYHPYRSPQDYPSSGSGFRGSDPGGFGHPMPMAGGPKRGFSARGGSPDHADGSKFAKLFIGSVPRTATEEDIRPLFEEHGEVIEVALIKDRKTGQQQGCCFIKYATVEQADRAIKALHNQHTLPGGSSPIQVRYADGDRERHGAVEHKLFVASLNKQATGKEIEEIFSQYGHVEDVYIMKDDLRQSRGCGFVKFATREDAVKAMNALHGNYVMRGCDQPLIVRFADPKRPRTSELRGGPAFGGPGFSPRSVAAVTIRPTANLDEPRGGRMPPDAWHPLSPQSLGPSSHFNAPDYGSHSSVMATSAVAPGNLGATGGPTGGALSSLSVIQPSSSQQGPSMASVYPIAGQQISSLQKPLMSPQNFPPSLQLHRTQQTPASQSQTQNLHAPMQLLGQLQVPQSGSLTSYGQNLPLQQLPGLGVLLSSSQPSVQQNASASALQNPLSLQQQAIPAVANQRQFPVSNITQQLLQQPIQQLPSQLPQMLLQQQAQALQSSFQSSQQAIFQLQQQLQLMQQSNLNQQQISQPVKQQSAWTGPPSTSSTPASTPAAAMPSTMTATSSLPVTSPPAVPLTCNWTEHTSPEGFKYYYNSITHESKWEKPEEFTLFEQQQQQQQQKLLLLQQQQHKFVAQQLQSPSIHAQPHTQVQPTQQVLQTQQSQPQPQPQMQMRQQAQLQLQPSIAYQASGVTGHQNMQELTYTKLQAASSVIDPTQAQQGIQAAQEWAWKNKNAGS